MHYGATNVSRLCPTGNILLWRNGGEGNIRGWSSESSARVEKISLPIVCSLNRAKMGFDAVIRVGSYHRARSLRGYCLFQDSQV